MLNQTDKGILLKVKVIPKASRMEAVGWEGDEFRIRLAAVPDKGKANEALIQFLSKILDIPKSQITLTKGDKSRHKQVLFSGLSLNDLKTRFLNAFKA